MELLNFDDETDYDETVEDSRLKDIQIQLDYLSSTVEHMRQESRPSERYLTSVSYRIFSKDFYPIRAYLKYQIVKPSVNRTPNDESRTLVFYHPAWPQMPVAQIVEYLMCGMTTKEYYLNLGYCRVLKNMISEEK